MLWSVCILLTDIIKSKIIINDSSARPQTGGETEFVEAATIAVATAPAAAKAAAGAAAAAARGAHGMAHKAYGLTESGPPTEVVWGRI